jgi:hypothetical protein
MVVGEVFLCMVDTVPGLIALTEDLLLVLDRVSEWELKG